MALSPPRQGLATRLLIRSSVYAPTWRYRSAKYQKPVDGTAARETLNQFNQLKMHPGHYQWNELVPYRGFIFSTFRKVDQKAMKSAYPEGAPGIPAEYTYPLAWSGQLLKVGASVLLMTQKITLPYIGLLGIPAEYRYAFGYLSLNAVRNVLADLISKHSVSFREWWDNLAHIKMKKLTDSLLVTAASYPVLSWVYQNMSKMSISDNWRWVAIPLVVTFVDGLFQSATRFFRGFSTKVAELDFFRPLLGDLSAASIFYSTGAALSLENCFSYLILRKIFCELWSGSIEGVDKRQQKIEQRRKNLVKIMAFQNYRTKDPQATAALNLVYFLEVKSLAKNKYLKRLKTTERKFDQKMAQLHQAMFDDQRMGAAVKELFAGDNWKNYANQAWGSFIDYRRAYTEWLETKAPDYYRKYILPLAKPDNNKRLA